MTTLYSPLRLHRITLRLTAFGLALLFAWPGSGRAEEMIEIDPQLTEQINRQVQELKRREQVVLQASRGRTGYRQALSRFEQDKTDVAAMEAVFDAYADNTRELAGALQGYEAQLQSVWQAIDSTLRTSKTVERRDLSNEESRRWLLGAMDSVESVMGSMARIDDPNIRRQARQMQKRLIGLARLRQMDTYNHHLFTRHTLVRMLDQVLDARNDIAVYTEMLIKTTEGIVSVRQQRTVGAMQNRLNRLGEGIESAVSDYLGPIGEVMQAYLQVQGADPAATGTLPDNPYSMDQARKML